MGFLMMSAVGGMGGSDHPLAGVRIMIVEDDFLVGIGLKKMLEKVGCEVFGPLPTIVEGHRMLEGEAIDIAVFDLNVIGGSIIPLAEDMRDRGLPFIFVTGFTNPQQLTEEMKTRPCLQKPVNEQTLYEILLAELD